jgi:hypothetical protein
MKSPPTTASIRPWCRSGKSRPPWSLPDVFPTWRERDAQGEEALKAELYQQIGQLKVELDWLKKNWSARLTESGE